MTTAPAAPPRDEVSLPVAEVRSAAIGLGIATPLRRLTAEGLLAAPVGRGRGRGRGRAYNYPVRVPNQLAAVAEAMDRSHRYATLRHAVWWRPQGQLEDWRLWQRDRLAEVAAEAVVWDLPATTDDELHGERIHHLLEVARGWRNSRIRGLPRKQLHTLADAESYVWLWTDALFTDDRLPPLDEDGAEETWRQVAATPMDIDEDGRPVGGTLGQLFQRGVGWPTPWSQGGGPGALACATVVPTPQFAWAILAAMPEERAVVLRDVVFDLATRAGSAQVLREQPLIAAVALAMMEIVDWGFPGRIGRRTAV